MGVFDFFKGKSNNDKETTRVVDGYEIGVESGIIYHCPRGLTEYNLPIGAKGLRNQACMDMNATAESIIIPASFKKFDSKNLLALNSARKLKSIKFPEGLEELDPTCINRDVAFNVPKSLKHLKRGVYEPPINGKLVIGENVKSLDSFFASHDCSIQSVEIFGSVDKLPDGAFNQCRNIKSVILHKGVKEAGNDAFKGTNKLQFVEIPEGFKGKFEASMEHRPALSKHMGVEAKYDPVDLDNDSNATLTINVEHLGQKYSFSVRRGDFHELFLEGNNISFNNGNISCDFSQLDPRATHTIQDGKMVSVLPPKLEEQRKVEQLREKLGGGSYQIKPQTQPSKPIKNLDKRDLAKYDLATVNKVISEICEKAGATQPSDLTVDDELSVNDEAMLAIALHARNSILKGRFDKNPSKELEMTYNKSSQLIDDLEAEAVIPEFSKLVFQNGKNQGNLLKMFDSKIKELNNDMDR